MSAFDDTRIRTKVFVLIYIFEFSTGFIKERTNRWQVIIFSLQGFRHRSKHDHVFHKLVDCRIFNGWHQIQKDVIVAEMFNQNWLKFNIPVQQVRMLSKFGWKLESPQLYHWSLYFVNIKSTKLNGIKSLQTQSSQAKTFCAFLFIRPSDGSDKVDCPFSGFSSNCLDASGCWDMICIRKLVHPEPSSLQYFPALTFPQALPICIRHFLEKFEANFLSYSFWHDDLKNWQ